MTKDKYNILLITGILSSEHDPRLNAWLTAMLESTGRFRVKMTEEFSGATAETLEKYDAVLINYDGRDNSDDPYVGWGKTAEKTLLDYVKAGGGAIVYHSSVISRGQAFSEEWKKMVGYEYSSESGGRKSPKLELTVNFTDKHEITKGLAPTWNTACDDFFANVKKIPGSDVTLLATVFDALEDYDLQKMQKHLLKIFENVDFKAQPNINEDHPVAWTNTYGKGRVVCVSIGHGIDTIRRPPFVGFMCRATEWACAGEVTVEPPNLDYLNRRRAWPYYLDMSVRDYAFLTKL
jgi:hypothetical protein